MNDVCESCRKFNLQSKNNWGYCHANPPVILPDGKSVRPIVLVDDAACRFHGTEQDFTPALTLADDLNKSLGDSDEKAEEKTDQSIGLQRGSETATGVPDPSTATFVPAAPSVPKSDKTESGTQANADVLRPSVAPVVPKPAPKNAKKGKKNAN